MDYAESRTGQLTALARSLLRRPTEKVRLLLLARTKGDWLEIIAASAPGLEVFQLATIEHIELPALSGRDGELGPAQAFTDAVLGLADRLPTLDGHRGVDWAAAVQLVERPPMSPARYANILEVQMTALAQLLSAAFRAPRPHSHTCPAERRTCCSGTSAVTGPGLPRFTNSS